MSEYQRYEFMTIDRPLTKREKESQEFQERFRAWVQPLLRRPSLVQRLQDRKFAW